MTSLVAGQLLEGHDYIIQPPSFAPDGSRFAAGDRSGILVVRERGDRGGQPWYAVAAQIQVPGASAHSQPQVRAVAWSPDGLLLATHEYGGVWLRDPNDLAALALARHVGSGPIAFGQHGAWLAALGESSLTILECPELAPRRSQVYLDRGGFEYFKLRALAADQHGTLAAVADDGGVDETAMGMALGRGEPQVTLIDVAQNAVVGAIGQGQQVHQVAFDRWRGNILTASYGGDFGVWSPNGDLRQRFAPYQQYVRAFAVAERWIATAASTTHGAATLDLWDAITLQPLATAPIPDGRAPDWIVASPDGRTLLTPELVSPGHGGIRVWLVYF